MVPISTNDIARAIAPFAVELSEAQAAMVAAYLDLLLRWNRQINLISVRVPAEILTRHFGESFYLARVVELRAQRLVDVGSGAGFPGLAIKIIRPELQVVLVESAGKKATFLKETVRTLAITGVEVEQARFEDLSLHWQRVPADIVTARAVGGREKVIRASAQILRAGGQLVLYLGRKDAEELIRAEKLFRWEACRPLPGARERVILLGAKG